MAFKLYYTPTSCGAANYITATLGGVEFDSEVVDLKTHTTASGVNFYDINPKGNVPTIVFDDGTLLNENVATLTFLADIGSADLAPEHGTPARYQYLNDIGFISSELHKAFGALFVASLSDAARRAAKATASQKVELFLTFLDQGKKRYLNGASLSAADIYAYIVLGWSKSLGVELPAVAQAYVEGIKADTRVAQAQAAMARVS